MADPSIDGGDEAAHASVSDVPVKPPQLPVDGSAHNAAAVVTENVIQPAAAVAPSHTDSDVTAAPSPSSSPSSAAAAIPASSSSSSASLDDASDGRNLYVDNLALSSDVELRNLFLPYGPILKSRLAIDPISRQPAGYGFVMFERREDALKAIDGLNQHVLGTKRLRVSVKRSKQQQQTSKPSADGSVSSLTSSIASLSTRSAGTTSSPAVAPSTLSSLSSPVVSSHLPVAADLPTAASPPSSASSSSSLAIASSPSSSSSSSSTNLYISGLPVSWRQSDVENLFASFGRITDSRLLLDRLTGQPRGVAMLRFESSASASAAIAALHRHYTPPNMQQTITVKYATDKPTQQQPAQPQRAASPLSAPPSSSQPAMITLTPGSASSLHRSLLPPATAASSTAFSPSSTHSPSSPPRSRLSAGISAALRGSPLIRLLHPSESSPSTHDSD